jgi:hypothetical protein
VPDWLLYSIVASVVLTVVLNVGLRLFPGIGRSLEDLFDRILTERVDTPDRADTPAEAPDERRVRVIVPWKLMLVASLILTLLLNLLLRLT